MNIHFHVYHIKTIDYLYDMGYDLFWIHQYLSGYFCYDFCDSPFF